MMDEGKYWETEDEKTLEEIFSRYTNLIDSFASALENIPRQKGESFEDYIIRIAKGVRK